MFEMLKIYLYSNFGYYVRKGDIKDSRNSNSVCLGIESREKIKTSVAFLSK